MGYGGAPSRIPAVVPFWSPLAADLVTLDTTPADKVFPSVTVAGLPSGVDLVAVYFMLAIANIVDTSVAANYIDGAGKALRLMLTGGAWATESVIGLTFDNLALYTASEGSRGGPVLVGPDIKATVNGNGVWLVQGRNTDHADSPVALGDDLLLYDVDCGLLFVYR